MWEMQLGLTLGVSILGLTNVVMLTTRKCIEVEGNALQDVEYDFGLNIWIIIFSVHNKWL